MSVQGWARAGLGNVVFNWVLVGLWKCTVWAFSSRGTGAATQSLWFFCASQLDLSLSVGILPSWDSGSSEAVLRRWLPESLLSSTSNYALILRKYPIQLTHNQFRPKFDPPQKSEDTMVSAFPYYPHTEVPPSAAFNALNLPNTEPTSWLLWSLVPWVSHCFLCAAKAFRLMCKKWGCFCYFQDIWNILTHESVGMQWLGCSVVNECYMSSHYLSSLKENICSLTNWGSPFPSFPL